MPVRRHPRFTAASVPCALCALVTAPAASAQDTAAASPSDRAAFALASSAAARAVGATPAGAARETPGVAGAGPTYQPPTAPERRRAYLADLLGPGAGLRAAGLAGIDQWQDDPTGWRQGADGYGRRVLSRAGGVAAQITLEHGLAAALRHDLRYTSLGRGPAASRVWHALSGAALARRANGRRTPSVGTLAGAYGGRLAETSWQPGGASHGDAVAAVAFTLAARGLVNVVREFRP